jgi:hypothetical protein
MKTRSGIGRPLDSAYPSNVFVLAMTPAAGTIAGLITLLAGDGLGDAFRNGFLSGGAAFLAWAIGREIDPDRPLSAGVAAVAAPALVAIGDPSLGVLAAVLLASRILVRSTGFAPGPIDLVVMAALAGYVATRRGGLPVALVLAVALAADRRLPGGAKIRSAIAALGAAAAAVAAAAFTGHFSIDPVAPVGLEWLIAGIALVGLVSVLRLPEVHSTTDSGSGPISPQRLWASRLAVAAAGLGALAWSGGPALAGFGAAWVAMAAAVLMAGVGASARR